MSETRRRVLVVEDQRLVAADLEDTLRRLGYDVVGNVGSGEEAIARAVEVGPDLAIMDIRLRGEMDGITAAAVIRERIDLPVIYLTAYADEETVRRAMITGPFGYLVKPFNERELRAAIDIAIYKHANDRLLADERARREAAEEFRHLVEGVADHAIFLLDPAGRVSTWNVGAERINGYSRDEIVGRHHAVFYTPEDVAAGTPEAELRAAVAQGHREQEGWRVRKDGSRFWATVTVDTLRDEQGQVRGFAKVTRDMSAHREAEREAKRQEALRLAAEEGARQALARSEQWLRTTLRSIGDAVVATDEVGRVRLMNAVAERLTGWTEPEAAGRAISEVFRIVNERSRAVVESPVDRVLRDGLVVGLANHTVLVAKDGVEHPIDDSGAPIVDADGNLLGVVLVFRDITERRRTEAELAEAHADVVASLADALAARAAAEVANDRLAFLAEAGGVLGASLDYEETLRNVARMAVPRLADWCSVDMVEDGHRRNLAVAHVDPAKLAMAEDLRRRYPPEQRPDRGTHAVARTGKSELYPTIPDEMLVRSAQDEAHLRLMRELGLRSAMVVPIAVGERRFGAIMLVSAESGRVFGAPDLSLAEELGRRAGLAIENARLFRGAEAANRMKDDFLATLSHELRTPLNAILGWAQLLGRGKLGEGDQRRAVDTIERNARLQAELIDDVLDVSRIVSGKLELELQPVDLVEIVVGVVNGVRPQAEGRGIAVSCAATPSSIATMGDPARLQQVVANLAENAVKFTPDAGRIDVTLEVAGDRVVLRVRDTGLGVSPAFLPHLFERFRQADPSPRRRHGGLGLGLSIVRHLVELHGGTVRAESEGEGKGATFVVELPWRSAMLPPHRPSDGEVTGSLEGLKVLVVDDEPDARALLASVLRGNGADVSLAASAAEALAILARWQADLLVSDIGMPEVDGHELLRRIRALPDRRAKIPAIAVTAYASVDDRARAVAAGYQRHVAKPVEPSTLLAVVGGLARPGP